LTRLRGRSRFGEAKARPSTASFQIAPKRGCPAPVSAEAPPGHDLTRPPKPWRRRQGRAWRVSGSGTQPQTCWL